MHTRGNEKIMDTKELNKELIDAIKERRSHPLIGIIGSTFPSREYSPEQGYEAGFVLREFLNGNKGNLFTGGVDGVGIDIYGGIIRYCYTNSTKTNTLADRFFVLVPETEFLRGKKGMQPVPYEPPQGYKVLGMLSSDHKLNVEVAGSNMAERRIYLAEIGDIFVVVNGGYGTIDEANLALTKQKPVISLSNTGGAARVLANIKTGSYDETLENMLKQNNPSIKSLFEPTAFQNILLASNIQEAITQISDYLDNKS